jgi:hypothetical protein
MQTEVSLWDFYQSKLLQNLSKDFFFSLAYISLKI